MVTLRFDALSQHDLNPAVLAEDIPHGLEDTPRIAEQVQAMLQAVAAGQQGVWIQPVALRYGRNEAPDPVAPFVGDDDLVSHLLRLLRRPGLEVQLALLPPVQAGDLDRRRVAERCRAMIADALEVDLTASSTSAPAALQRSGSLLAPEGSLGQAT
ncbi:MAG: hypothetical protein P8Y25_07440 [Chromatiaceae bacterium]